MPKGDPEVRELARVASEHASAYVLLELDPQIDDLRRFARSQTLNSESLFEKVRDDIEGLRVMVRALPGTIAEQVSQAKSLEDLPKVIVSDPTLHQEINQLQSTYPWLAPRLVRMRHAVSRQAIDEHVLGPAGDQMGI